MTLLADLACGDRLTRDQALALVEGPDLGGLCRAAAQRRDAGHRDLVSYSRKVFIPLTQLCRDVCHYCTFARAPRNVARPYLSIAEVVEVARRGKAAGCREALFTLGDRPEHRYRAAREELQRMGHGSTLSYLAEAAAAVIETTGLMPHLNPGIVDGHDLAALRKVSVSQGLMLETAAARLSARGGPHFGSPDKVPHVRLKAIAAAGAAAVPFTSGILIGISETRAERLEALFALRDLNDAHGHIQEVIIQNFRPKAGTRMAAAPPPSLAEHLWTIAMARLIFEPGMNIQAPPNLSPGALKQMVDAGINDWGGVSPVTPDYVNPEAPWPHLRALEAATSAVGKRLVERLAIYPAFARDAPRWLDPAMQKSVLDQIDGQGRPRTDDWHPGHRGRLPVRETVWLSQRRPRHPRADVAGIVARAEGGRELSEGEIATLFEVEGREFSLVCRAADGLRRDVNGDAVSYVVTRNINYTNICSFRCRFCAFSKGRMSDNLRGRPYDLDLGEVVRRVTEARARGASEVCMQGGIHPSYTGDRYLDICRAVKAAEPDIHIHAFSPLEVHHGAQTLGVPVSEFLRALRTAGLGTLPGTAAEILDDEVRAVLCPDKIGTDAWLEVMRAANAAGFRSTATIMFGHVEHYRHWARHLIRIRRLQLQTGGFTEFVPLPFVHMEAPIYLKGRARPGPSFRETLLMHAVARLALHPVITNIQASWVKLGAEGVRHCLSAGVNDLGGTLMDESISRSAGASHGQEMTPQEMEAVISSAGRVPRQRTTLYGDVAAPLRARSFAAARERTGGADAAPLPAVAPPVP